MEEIGPAPSGTSSCFYKIKGKKKEHPLTNPHYFSKDNQVVKLIRARQLVWLALQSDQPRVNVLPVPDELSTAFRELDVKDWCVRVQLVDLSKRARDCNILVEGKLFFLLKKIEPKNKIQLREWW